MSDTSGPSPSSAASTAAASAGAAKPPRSNTPRRRLLRLLRAAAVVYAIYCVAGCAMLRSVIFPRHMVQPIHNAGHDIAGLQRWALDTDEGPVEAWFAPAPAPGSPGSGASATGAASGEAAANESPRPAVIFAHGNAELIDYQKVMVDGYRRLGVSVLLVEYRGYGRSAGSPTQDRITADHVAAYDRLIQLPGVDRQRVFFHGRSIGTGVVCALAAQRRPAALILTSPMTSVRAMAARYLVPGFLVRDPFDNRRVVASFDGPILLAHGARDTIIPFSHSQQLAAANPARTTLIKYDCGHNDIAITSPEFWHDIAAFLRASGIIQH